jgi:Transcription factor WhiB
MRSQVPPSKNGGMSFIERVREDGWPGSRLSGNDLWALVISRALCSQGGLDPDQWYPVSGPAPAARREAARAIAICAGCVVRTHCLELSLRNWAVGQHGIWGGTVPAERAALRRELTEGPGVTAGEAAHGDRAAS